MKVIIATNNNDKAKEIKEVLDFYNWQYYTLKDLGIKSDPIEDGSTFKENALIKALSAKKAAREVFGGVNNKVTDKHSNICEIDVATDDVEEDASEKTKDVDTKSAIKDLKEAGIDGASAITDDDRAYNFYTNFEKDGVEVSRSHLTDSPLMVADYSDFAFMADDSGLCVDALDGAPGLYSARFAATNEHNATYKDNNNKLLALMKGIPQDKRGAFFQTDVVLILPNGQKVFATGRCFGRIANDFMGSGGFGYDPIFCPEVFDYKLSMAQLPIGGKSKISHRGNALRNLKAKISELHL